jgi:hypothetical protein
MANGPHREFARFRVACFPLSKSPGFQESRARAPLRLIQRLNARLLLSERRGNTQTRETSHRSGCLFGPENCGPYAPKVKIRCHTPICDTPWNRHRPVSGL